MKVHVKYKSDYVYEAFDELNNAVYIDMAEAERTAMRPSELLLSALGSCAAVDIVLILKKKRKNVLDIQIEVDGERQEDYPRFFTKIHCKYTLTSPNTTPAEFKAIVQLVVDKYCTVGSSLKAPISMECIVI